MSNTFKNLKIMLNNLPQMHLKLLQKNQKTAEAIGDLIGNKIADKITKASENPPQNTPKAVPSEIEDKKTQC